MKEKFKWDKFIADCFISMFLIHLSAILIGIPLYLVIADNLGITLNTTAAFSSMLFFAIWFLLEKRDIKIQR